MICENQNSCICPKSSCKNHGHCCACVNKHKNTDSLPYCLFPDNGGDKSNLNCYFVTSVDICLAAFCVGCKLLHAAKAPDFRRRAAPRAKALWLHYPPLPTKKKELVFFY